VGVEMPLTVTQILWINLIIDTFASLALSTIPPTPAVMTEKPRRQTDFIINRSVTRNVFLSTLLFSVVMLWLTMAFDTPWALTDTHATPLQLTIIFTVFVMLQFWNLFNAKAWQSGRSAFSGLGRCRGLLVVLGIILVGQILIVTFGGTVFRTVPMSPVLWLVIIGLTSLTLWIGEITRLFTRRHE
jgi:Ca2+-transporting ATPase